MAIPPPEELLPDDDVELLVPLTPSANATPAPAQSLSPRARSMSDFAARTREAHAARTRETHTPPGRARHAPLKRYSTNPTPVRPLVAIGTPFCQSTSIDFLVWASVGSVVMTLRVAVSITSPESPTNR